MVNRLEQTLRAALRDAAKEYELALCTELDGAALPHHRFGRAYRERKRQLIATVNGARPPATLRRRVLIPLIAVLMMLAAAMSVQAIRGPVISFIVNAYQEMTDFLIRTDPPAKSARLDFSLAYIPGDYKLIHTLEDSGLKMEMYEDGKGGDFSFALYYYVDGINFSIDTENAVVTETTYHGKRMVISQKDPYLNIAIFDFTNNTIWNFIGTLSQEEAMKILENAGVK